MDPSNPVQKDRLDKALELFDLGRVYESEEQLTRAVECYARALEHDAGCAQARASLLAARRKIN